MKKNKRFFISLICFFVLCFSLITLLINSAKVSYAYDEIDIDPNALSIKIHTKIDENGTQKDLSNIGFRMATIYYNEAKAGFGIFKKDENNYLLTGLTSNDKDSTQVKTDSNGIINIGNLSGEGAYYFYETEVSNGINTFYRIKVELTKEDDKLVASIVTDNKNIQLTKIDDKNYELTFIHEKDNSSSTSKCPTDKCIYKSYRGPDGLGSKSGINVEMKAYPPFINNWEAGVDVKAYYVDEKGEIKYNLTEGDEEENGFEHLDFYSKQNSDISETVNSHEFSDCIDFDTTDKYRNSLKLHIEMKQKVDNYNVFYELNYDGEVVKGNNFNKDYPLNLDEIIKCPNCEMPTIKIINWDKRYGDLSVKKVVVGEDVSADKEFGFSLVLTPKNGEKLEDTYSYTLNGAEETKSMTFENDNNSKKATFKLKQGDTIRFIGLPASVEYVVSEDATNEYTVTSTNTKGTIPSGDLVESVFTNTKGQVGDITISKSVTGLGDTEKEFKFTLTLDNKNVQGRYGDLTFKDGVAEFTLKNNESKKALSLPAGVKYQVKEEDYSKEGYTTTSTNEEGTIVANKNIDVKYINDLQNIVASADNKTNDVEVPKTGDNTIIWMITFVVSVIGLIINFISYRKKVNS